MVNSNQINLTAVAFIVLISFGFFGITFYTVINHFKNNSVATDPSSASKQSATDDRCLINSTTGLIRGHLLIVNNTSVCEYLGIPYAQAPVGELRFKPPLPMKKWDGVWEANQLAANCIQTFPDWAKFMMRPVVEEINEDCLYLNVWTPIGSADAKKKPIIFWIHGGGYQFGSGTLAETNGSTLASVSNLIVVTINYRLNALGFLNLNSFYDQFDERQSNNNLIRGNQGLYDQKMALDWIRSNADQFNGDIDQITLWGQGMGAISISIHLISPLMRNKFNRAILQTGSLFTSRQMYSRSEIIGEQLTNSLNCDIGGESDYDAKDGGSDDGAKDLFSEADEILKCLQKKDFEEIRAVVESINAINPISFMFNPIENFLNFTNPSEIKTDLVKLISPSVTELIIGFNSDEGSLLLSSLLPELFQTNGTDLPQIRTVTEAKDILIDLFVNRLNVPKSVLDVGLGSAFAAISSLTSGQENDVQRKMIKSMIDFVGNNIFVCPSILAAQELSNQVKGHPSVHVYSYTKRTSYNNLPSWFGTIHNEEVPIMFGHPFRTSTQENDRTNYTDEEKRFSSKLMDMIGAFATDGSLPPYWEQYTSSNQKYLDINPVQFKVRSGIHDKSCSLFEIGMDLA